MKNTSPRSWRPRPVTGRGFPSSRCQNWCSVVLLASAAAYTAAVLGCFIAIPQIALLVRSRDATGLSVRSWQISCLSASAWFAYGVRVDQPAQILANSCAMVGGVLVLWFALEPGTLRRNELGGFSVVAALVACAVVTVPLPWLTAPLAATGIASRIPQVRATASTWWNRRSSSVSATTWAMTVLVATLWLVDGLIIGDAAIAGSAALSAVSAGLILLAETSSRPTSWQRRPAVPNGLAPRIDRLSAPVPEAGRVDRPLLEPASGELVAV
jgi:uncharacterized protein with PQ loop repeat